MSSINFLPSGAATGPYFAVFTSKADGAVRRAAAVWAVEAAAPDGRKLMLLIWAPWMGEEMVGADLFRKREIRGEYTFHLGIRET